jgi:2-dehydropantoate 2-reductase
MKVLVVGAGAVGCLLGGMAAEAGHEVCFAGSPESGRRLAAHGLRLVLPTGWVRLRKLMTAPPARWRPELAIVALKRHHLREPAALPPAARGAPALLVLNADPAKDRPLVGFTLLTAVRLEPGEVELASPRSVLVLPRHDALRGLHPAWKSGGLEVVESDAQEALSASFFLWQLLFLPVALCHSTLGHFLASAAGREIALGVLEEGLAAFRRAGRALKKLPFQDPQEMVQKLRRRGQDFAGAEAGPDREYNSLLQSLLRGQKTETRELNEKMVRIAAETGLAARWSWGLSQKLSRVIQVGFFHGPEELLRSLKG